MNAMNTHILFRDDDILVTPAMARFGAGVLSDVGNQQRRRLSPAEAQSDRRDAGDGGLRLAAFAYFGREQHAGLQPLERDRGAGRADPRHRLAADAPGPRIPAGDEGRGQRDRNRHHLRPRAGVRAARGDRRAPSTCRGFTSSAACADRGERRRPRDRGWATSGPTRASTSRATGSSPTWTSRRARRADHVNRRGTAIAAPSAPPRHLLPSPCKGAPSAHGKRFVRVQGGDTT